MAATTTLSLRNFLEKQKQKQQKVNHVLLEKPEQVSFLLTLNKF